MIRGTAETDPMADGNVGGDSGAGAQDGADGFCPVQEGTSHPGRVGD